MYFQAKTGIFASCVIYCGSHLHIKALISPSECVCVLCERGWGECNHFDMQSEEGRVISITGAWFWTRGEQSHLLYRFPLWTGWFWDGARWSYLMNNTWHVSLSFLITSTLPNQEVWPALTQEEEVRYFNLCKWGDGKLTASKCRWEKVNTTQLMDYKLIHKLNYAPGEAPYYQMQNSSYLVCHLISL